MAPYIKLFQKYQNLHLYALGGNLSYIKIVKYPTLPKQAKTLIWSPQKEIKTPKVFTTHKGKIIKNIKEAQ
jgi:hypothetical protein